MGDLNTPTQALLSAFKKAADLDNRTPKTTGAFKVSRAISAAAFWYEKLRTAMEYRDEHLLRRSAIQRILTRRLLQTNDSTDLATFLLKELIWARYLQSNQVHEDDIVKIAGLIEKYLPIVSRAANPIMRNWLIAIAASDLEKVIAESYWTRQEALANFVYYFLNQQLEFSGNLSQDEAHVQLYIAIWRAFVHADEELISFQLIKQKYPDWEAQLSQFEGRFEDVKNDIDKDLQSPLSEKLQRFVERNIPAFLVVRDMLEDFPDQEQTIIADPEKLEEVVNQICQKRYHSTRDLVRRAVFRSIIYIFLTKMIFAFILEIPIDRLISGGVSYLVLAINSLFPPVLMFALSLSIQIPDQSNTNRIVSLLKHVFYDGTMSLPKARIQVGEATGKPILSAIFKILYGLAFLVSFGIIYYVLNQLHFSLISKAVFVFFVSVVSFFAYRIRKTAHQYLFEEKEGLLSPITDFFWVPVLRVGRIFSNGLEQINLLLFFFDLAIEAPFKVIFDLAEEWSSFIRSKKEEIG